MLKALLYDAKRWRDILNAISTLLEEAEFKVSPESMELRAMDSAHTAMVDLSLPRAFFDEYKCDQPTELRVNLKNLLNLLTGLKNESMEINYFEEVAKLVVYLRGEYERTFTLSTLSIEKEFGREARAVFSVSAKVQTASLERVVSDAQKIGDNISIEAKPDAITFRTMGLTGNVVSIFKTGESPLAGLTIAQESKATYSLDPFATIIRNALSLSDIINLEYSTDKVLRLDLGLSQGKLHFYLSPMLEST